MFLLAFDVLALFNAIGGTGYFSLASQIVELQDCKWRHPVSDKLYPLMGWQL